MLISSTCPLFVPFMMSHLKILNIKLMFLHYYVKIPIYGMLEVIVV